MPVGFLQNNIDEVAKQHNLQNDHNITKPLISQIFGTGKHCVTYGQGNDFPAAVLKIEDKGNNIIITI